MLGSVWGMVRLSELHLGRRSVGFIAGALASIIHAQLDFWHTAQPETFGGTLTIWGLVLATQAHRAQGLQATLRWAATGVLFGCAVLMSRARGGSARDGLAPRPRGLVPQRGQTKPPLSASHAARRDRHRGTFPRGTLRGRVEGRAGDLHQVLFVLRPLHEIAERERDE